MVLVSMKLLDRLLQRWRMKQACRWLPKQVKIIDVGAHEGELFEYLGKQLREGFGVEPLLQQPKTRPRFTIHGGYFPAVRPPGDDWDAITMLAVLEHVPRAQQRALSDACFTALKSGGVVVITVPSHAVDYILNVLRFLRLIHGMSLEEHFGFEPDETPRIFSRPRFALVQHRRFQLGLNHLFVFRKL